MLLNVKPHQLARTPRPSLTFWNLEFVKYSVYSQGCRPLATENFAEHRKITLAGILNRIEGKEKLCFQVRCVRKVYVGATVLS